MHKVSSRWVQIIEAFVALAAEVPHADGPEALREQQVHQVPGQVDAPAS